MQSKNNNDGVQFSPRYWSYLLAKRHLRGTSRPQVFPIFGANRANLKQKIGGSQGMRVYDIEGVSATIASQTGGWGAKTGLYDIDTKIRRLTPIECERLQGFPDGWTEGLSDTQRYKCMGNAVTTNVITEIGERIANCT